VIRVRLILECVSAPTTDELRRLMHALREPVGALVINLSLLDNEDLSVEGQKRLDATLGNVQRMVEAIAALTGRFGLEGGSATPLAILSKQDHPGDRRSRDGADQGSASAPR
jgi:hypothetical protein